MPISPYDMWPLSRYGTDPVASPIGTPCRKYSSTSSPKLRRSSTGSSRNPWLFIRGVSGTPSSSENDSRDMRFSVTAAESPCWWLPCLPRYSTVVFISRLVPPLPPPRPPPPAPPPSALSSCDVSRLSPFCLGDLGRRALAPIGDGEGSVGGSCRRRNRR